jgi:hypothetical protein
MWLAEDLVLQKAYAHWHHKKRTCTVDKEVLQQTFGKRMYSMVLPRR